MPIRTSTESRSPKRSRSSSWVAVSAAFSRPRASPRPAFGTSEIIDEGSEYELDCLIYATGFEVGADYTSTVGFELYGCGGQSLSEKWKSGAETLHSMFTRGFPNCFVLATMQSGQSANFHHMLDEKAKYIAFVVAEAKAQGIKTLEPSAEAEKDWVDTVVKLAIGRRAFLYECTPCYYNSEGGELDLRIARNNQYWRGPVQFLRILDLWRRDGSMPGLELTR
jgi:hypothetical protein